MCLRGLVYDFLKALLQCGIFYCTLVSCVPFYIFMILYNEKLKGQVHVVSL